jgi:hypothetical protein
MTTAYEEGTVAVGMPGGTCWANSDFSNPPAPGFYRVARHVNALEYFARWTGTRWTHPSTSADAAQKMKLTAEQEELPMTRWWRLLEDGDVERFTPIKENARASSHIRDARHVEMLSGQIDRLLSNTCIRQTRLHRILQPDGTAVVHRNKKKIVGKV